jgi:hypothetical protein
VLAEVEATALKIYADHGLPVMPGHYRRAPDSSDWVHLGANLDPGMRWTMVLERPVGSGWTFATLEDLGRHETGSPELQAASSLLTACRGLRDRGMGRAAGDPVENLEAAVRLGVEWHGLRQLTAWKDASRLKLIHPETDPAPKSAKRSRAAKRPGAEASIKAPRARTARPRKT